jgi:hypothetical protein
MASYNDIIKRYGQGFDVFPEEFIKSISKVQNKFFAEILPLFDNLVIENGVILANAENFAIANDIQNRLQTILSESGYTAAMRNMAIGMNEQKILTEALYTLVTDGAAANFTEFAALYTNSQRTALQLIGEGAITNFSTQFTQALEVSISSSSTFSQLINNIRTVSVGNSEVEGVLERYAKQNAKDSFSVTARVYSNAIAKKYGVEWFKYGGSLMDSSRPFCVERARKVFHYKEVEMWGNGKKCCGLSLPQSGTWAGKNRATNSETIFTLLGGYNCNHVLEPLGIRDVPKNKILEAIEKEWVKVEDLPQSVRRKLGLD